MYQQGIHTHYTLQCLCWCDGMKSISKNKFMGLFVLSIIVSSTIISQMSKSIPSKMYSMFIRLESWPIFGDWCDAYSGWHI